jgi:hypothetical protein
MEPELRKKHTAKNKRRDKGNPYASSKHVRIELENQYRHYKRNTSSRCILECSGNTSMPSVTCDPVKLISVMSS